MKVFYEQQNLRMSKFVYTLNPQPKFFRRSAPLFRGGFYFAGVLKCQNFSYLGGGFYFTGGFYFAMEGTELEKKTFSRCGEIKNFRQGFPGCGKIEIFQTHFSGAERFNISENFSLVWRY